MKAVDLFTKAPNNDRLVKSIYGDGQKITVSENRFTPPKIRPFSKTGHLKGPPGKIY